jgi:hypothetical protein
MTQRNDSTAPASAAVAARVAPAARTPARAAGGAQASKALGWPKRCQLAHAFLWEYSHQGLKLAQLLGQLGVFRTSARRTASRSSRRSRSRPRARLGVKVI